MKTLIKINEGLSIEEAFRALTKATLNEGRTYLNGATKKFLLSELKLMQLGGNIPETARPSQTSLKNFLCELYKIPKSKNITVHHANLDYTDYSPDNIYLVNTREHSAAHNKYLNAAIERVIYNKGISKKQDIHKLQDVDFSEQELSEIYFYYFEDMQEWLSTNALNKGKIAIS